MAKPVFRYYIDFAGTGAFASEVTSVLISAQWQLGFSQPFDLVARDNTAELVVQNITRDFSPEYASGAYYGNVLPGRAVKITSTYASVTRTMASVGASMVGSGTSLTRMSPRTVALWVRVAPSGLLK